MDAQAKEAGLGIGRVGASIELLEAESALRSHLEPHVSRRLVHPHRPDVERPGRVRRVAVAVRASYRTRGCQATEGQSHQRPCPE
jgi:hypothetical protein